MQVADKKHRGNLNTIEYKFFTEKVRSSLKESNSAINHDVWHLWGQIAGGVKTATGLILRGGTVIGFVFAPQARLEREAEQRVGVLSERAHTEAILWVGFLRPSTTKLKPPKLHLSWSATQRKK